MKNFIVFLFMLLGSTSLWAQIPDSIQQLINAVEKPAVDSFPTDSLAAAFARLEVDTTAKKKRPVRDFLVADYPNPKKAALFSIVPGGGQIYNKRFWKLPLVYGAYVGIGYYLVNNINARQSFNDAYEIRLDVEGRPDFCRSLLCEQIVNSNLSNDSIKARRQSQLKQLQLSYIGVVAVVILTAADAFVDAHLKSFDVDDDLSFRIKPTLQTGPFGTQAGVGLVFNF